MGMEVAGGAVLMKKNKAPLIIQPKIFPRHSHQLSALYLGVKVFSGSDAVLGATSSLSFRHAKPTGINGLQLIALNMRSLSKNVELPPLPTLTRAPCPTSHYLHKKHVFKLKFLVKFT